MSAEVMATTYARPRAALGAAILAAIFAVGLVSGVVVAPAFHTITQPVSAGGAIVTGEAVAETHLAWLQSEHDSYPGLTTVSAATAAEAHLAWLQSEHDSYPAFATVPISDSQAWLAYHQFRLSEEGYGQ